MNRDDLQIEKILVVSTAHVTPGTAAVLPTAIEAVESKPEEWWPAFTRNESWLFFVGGDCTEYLNAPSDLLAVIQFASNQGCDWLMLDRDGERIDELPSWDW